MQGQRLLLIFVFSYFRAYCKVVETLAAQEAPLIIFELAAVNICVLPIPCASLQRSFMAMSGNCPRPIADPDPCAAARARAYITLRNQWQRLRAFAAFFAKATDRRHLGF